ncbi:hypothetical protein PILCRDRAFT_12069 [Piloderma croceum F 1598]|uniref:Amine oxidase domain-containing protein n=1 Tax=Piloderma croceum (strain F 1598) TaxID=765440 RepID=A0A0C3AU17_PILCF|nr:hypothetical protein PILCRDRAFT_12069 [Piloderma croceum F 1598]
MVSTSLLRFLALLVLSLLASGRSTPQKSDDWTEKDQKILILGGGVAGVIAAWTLHEHGHDNFIIIEARDELGGRMRVLYTDPHVPMDSMWTLVDVMNLLFSRH